MASDDTPLLSVLIPVYNEIATLAKVIAKVRAVPLDLEIVVVDDGSQDGSRSHSRVPSCEPSSTTTISRSSGTARTFAITFASVAISL